MRRHPWIPGLVLIAALALLGPGCGDRGESTPVACLEGAGAYLGALDAAPGAVRLRGEIPISGCLVENQEGGDLATVGAAMVEAATRLNAGARAERGGAAGVRLGYLVGAAERGAEGTAGIHADLLRRLESAALHSPDGRSLPEGFRSAYRRGYEAGSRSG